MTDNSTLIRAVVPASGPAAIGPYSPAVSAGGFLFCSGQMPFDPETGEVVGSDVSSQTRQVFENLNGLLAAAGLTMDDVVKATVFLVNIDDFAEMNTVYGEYFAEPYPARSTVGVSALAKGALVEIEVVAVLPN